MSLAAKRTLYHTHLKYLAYQKLLSHDILSQIPKSTRYRWSVEDPLRYETFSLNLKACEDFQIIHHFAHNKRAKRIYTACMRIAKFLLPIVHKLPQFHRSIKAQCKNVVLLVQRIKDVVGLKRVLLILDVSVQTYRNWLAQSHTTCYESIINSCKRVFHNQLSRPEIIKLKEMMADKQFQFWPVSSIALYAKRNNLLALSINTWYKYVHRLGICAI